MLIHLKKYDHPQVECFFITVIWFLLIDHFAELHLSVTFPGCLGGCRRWLALAAVLPRPLGCSHRDRAHCCWLQGGQVPLHLPLPPMVAGPCFLPCPSGRSVGSQIPEPGFLKQHCSSCTRQGGNNDLEVLPKYLSRPAYDRYCCPDAGLELGGLDSVPLILMSWIQRQHLFWNILVVFLLLPLNYITCKWDKDWGSCHGVILNEKAEDEFLEMLVSSRTLQLVNYGLNFKEKQNKILDMKMLSVL